MNKIFLFIVLFIGIQTSAQELPVGVTIDSSACNYAPGLYTFYYYKNNEMVGMILPDACNYNGVEEDGVNKYFITDFYSDYSKDTFNTQNEARNWLVKTMNVYYQPVEIVDWQNVEVQVPKVGLKCPADWTYRQSSYDGVFKSNSSGDNKLTLLITEKYSSSEICMIIRTPNTAKLTTAQVVDINAKLNGAINVKESPLTDFVIGGKTFKTSKNTFMLQMDQTHFWFADDEEIIYVNYNLLRDERLRYPEVMNTIIESIQW
jgi:hypothetical protein